MVVLVIGAAALVAALEREVMLGSLRTRDDAAASKRAEGSTLHRVEPGLLAQPAKRPYRRTAGMPQYEASPRPSRGSGPSRRPGWHAITPKLDGAVPPSISCEARTRAIGTGWWAKGTEMSTEFRHREPIT